MTIAHDYQTQTYPSKIPSVSNDEMNSASIAQDALLTSDSEKWV